MQTGMVVLSRHLRITCAHMLQSVQAFANLSKTGDIYGKFLSRMQSAANSKGGVYVQMCDCSPTDRAITPGLYAVPFETVMKEAILVPCLERFRSVDAFVVRHFISSCNLYVCACDPCR